MLGLLMPLDFTAHGLKWALIRNNVQFKIYILFRANYEGSKIADEMAIGQSHAQKFLQATAEAFKQTSLRLPTLYGY